MEEGFSTIVTGTECSNNLDAVYLAAVTRAQKALAALAEEEHATVRYQLTVELDSALELLRASAGAGHVHSKTALSFLGSRDGEMSSHFLRRIEPYCTKTPIETGRTADTKTPEKRTKGPRDTPLP